MYSKDYPGTNSIPENKNNYFDEIPFENFVDVKHIGSGGSSCVYSATWMKPGTDPMKVALKRLNNSLNISSSYFKQIKSSSVEIFGITKDSTSNYMIVMRYYENGNLYKYLDCSNGVLAWRNIIYILWRITGGLKRIHAEGKIHRNLHGGNLLIIEDEKIDVRISDTNLYGPCNENLGPNQIYGVLPYTAPEVLRGENYTAASDIYSFGIIMNTLATGKRPWYDRAHDISLAKDICEGNRPEIPQDIPGFYLKLMKKCWNGEAENRPTAASLYEKLEEWFNLTETLGDNPKKKKLKMDPGHSKFFEKYSIAIKERQKMINKSKRSKYTHPKIDPKAYYTSRFLCFPELSNMTKL